MEKDNKQYCWHSSVVDHDAGVALVLRVIAENEDLLEITMVPLADLLEQTLELIGTNVNGNPYGDYKSSTMSPAIHLYTLILANVYNLVYIVHVLERDIIQLSWLSNFCNLFICFDLVFLFQFYLVTANIV